MSARLGSVFAPLINETVRDVIIVYPTLKCFDFFQSTIFKPLPLIIFGTVTLIGGCLSLILPETLNKQLPESIADGEQFGK